MGLSHLFAAATFMIVRETGSQTRWEPVYQGTAAFLSGFYVWDGSPSGPTYLTSSSRYVAIPSWVGEAASVALFSVWLHLGVVAIVHMLRSHSTRESRHALTADHRSRVLASTLMRSAWSVAIVLPIAGGVWAFWAGVSKASLPSQGIILPGITLPGSLLLVTPALAKGLHVAAIVLAYFGLTWCAYRKIVLRDAIYAACEACGYLLASGGRCPECGHSSGRDDSREGRRFVRAMAAAWPAVAMWLVIAGLLVAPAGKLLLGILRRHWENLSGLI